MEKIKSTLKYWLELVKWHVNEFKYKFSKAPILNKIGAVVGGIVVLLLLLGGITIVLGGSDKEPVKEEPVVDTRPAAVPNVVSLERSNAEKKLSDLGFATIVVKGDPDYTGGNSDEVIISQNPTAGKIIRKNEQIILTFGNKDLVEAGKKKVEVPSVVGLTTDNAVNELKQAGFIKITYKIPDEIEANRAIVTVQEPQAEIEAPLNTDVRLDIGVGFQWDITFDKLSVDFKQFNQFSKIENPEGEDIILVFKKKEPTLINVELLSKRANTYKMAFENILGRDVGKVILMNPGVDVVGDSESAVKNTTRTGLTTMEARESCSREIGRAGYQTDWNSQTLKIDVTDDSITFLITGFNENLNKEGLITCKVIMDEDRSKIAEFLIQ